MSTQGARRILKDFKIIQNEKSEHFSVSPNEDDIFQWKGYILPPNDSLYFGLILPFEIKFPSDYPNKPPLFQFQPNSIFHPNVYENGNICLDVLSNKWSKLHNVNSIILTLILLLKEPNPDSPANNKAAQLFLDDPKKFKQTVREYTLKSWVVN